MPRGSRVPNSLATVQVSQQDGKPGRSGTGGSPLLTPAPLSPGADAEQRGLGAGPTRYAQMTEWGTRGGTGEAAGAGEDRTGIRNDVDKSEKWPENNQIQFKRTSAKSWAGAGSKSAPASGG